MALYLVQGKFLGGSLYSPVLVSLACLLAVQSIWAMTFRFLVLKGKNPPSQFSSKKIKGELFSGIQKKASQLLIDNGFQQSGQRNDKANQTYFRKRIKSPLVFEILAYSALIFILFTGIMNYGLGIGGQIKITPGGEMIDMGVVYLDKGFLAEQFSPFFMIRASSLTDTTSYDPSTIVLEVLDKKSWKLTSHRISTGESITVNRLRMEYIGDAYTTFISIYKGIHDYRPVPIRFESRTDISGNIYKAPIFIREPGTRGEGALDIVSKKLSIKVYRDEDLEFDGELLSGEKTSQGEMKVQFTSLMHYGIIDISRYGYRNYILSGIAALIFFLILRIFIRPEMVCLWSKGDNVFFYTRNRSVRALLRNM